MREVIEEIVEVLERHGIDVDLDSAQIEICGAEIMFRCRDLNREAWEMMDRMRTF